MLAWRILSTVLPWVLSTWVWEILSCMCIAEPTLADAIMDRLISKANEIELKGESMRQKRKK